MKKNLLSNLILLFSALFFSNENFSQLVSGNSFLQGKYVEVGVGPCGTYGTTVNAPAGYHPRSEFNPSNRILGFVADPEKNGWDAGSPNYCGDYFVPGTPEEGFGLQINGVNYNNNLLCRSSEISGSVTEYRVSGSNILTTWQGSAGGVQISSVVSVPINDVFFITTVTLKNTTSSIINNIYYMRNVDPDQEEPITLNYTTNNFIVAQNPNATSRALVSARGLAFGCYLGLGTKDCRARVTFGGFSNRNPAAVYNGTEGLSQSGNTTADVAISISFKINSLAPGETATFKLAHVLAAEDLDRALALTDPTISVNDIPIANGASVNVCKGVAIPLKVVNASEYNWNWTPATGLNKTTGSEVLATVNSTTTYTATGTNVCGTTNSLSVTLIPSLSSSIGSITSTYGSSVVCLPSANIKYRVDPVPDANLYEWTVPSGVSIINGDGTNEITVSFSSSNFSGDVSVRARNGCGVSNTSTLTVSGQTCSNYYTKATGDIHSLTTWGTNPDGSGANPPDFGAQKVFNLANRSSVYTLTANWSVGGVLNIPSGSELRINGNTLTETLIYGSGSLSGSSTSNLIINGSTGGDAGTLNFTTANNILNNLTLNRTPVGSSATISTPLNILGVLTVANGILNTNNLVTLKSTATNTARVAPIPSTANVLGMITVERYIPARKAWRLLAAPVGGSQSINSAWQEGVTTSSPNPNPNPGFGTQITGGSVANGFDQAASSSLKTYNSAIDNFVAVANTNATSVNSTAYMLFVAGDRTLNPSNTTIPATNTVLRSKGPLKIGDQSFPVAASGYVPIANPFASPINFGTITKNNVQNSFYVWDPKMGGANGVGAWVNISWNGSAYVVTPASASPESQYIQSGQGFLVHSTGVAGSIVIKETDKSSTPATNVFRSAVTNTPELRVNLQVNRQNELAVLDEVLMSYNAKFSKKIDEFDVLKLANIGENLSIVRSGANLMVERRPEISGNDTIALHLSTLSSKENYLLEFNPSNLASSELNATLEDSYLNTSTPLNLSSTSQVFFQINSQTASQSPDRFKIVMAAKTSLPIVSIANGFKAFPNPMSGRTINVQFGNQPKGIYNIELVNNLGAVVHRVLINHDGGSVTKTFQLNNLLSKGIYQMKISNGTIKNSIKVIAN